MKHISEKDVTEKWREVIKLAKNLQHLSTILESQGIECFYNKSLGYVIVYPGAPNFGESSRHVWRLFFYKDCVVEYELILEGRNFA